MNKTQHPNRILSQGPEENRAFWSDVGEGYKLLCRMTDDADWAAILETIATQINASVPSARETINILDLGAGTGIPAAELSNILLSRFSRKSMWSLVEPDAGARQCCEYSFASIPGIPGSAGVYANLNEVVIRDHDVALLMHSTYEIANLKEAIGNLRGVLREDAPIVCLVLPRSSQFFAVGGRFHGCAEDVLGALAATGYQANTMKLTSRIHVLSEVLNNVTAVGALKSFANCGHMNNEEFARRVRTHWPRNVDFDDQLVVAIPGG